VQSVKRSPIDLRPLLGIPDSVSAKSIALLATGLLHIAAARHDERLSGRAEALLAWLAEIRLPGFHGPCWGYPFDVHVRSFSYLRGSPTLVVTSFCAQAFLEGWRLTGNPRWREVALGVGEFILRDLEPFPMGEGLCLPYFPGARAPIHNASLLGAGLLVQLHALSGEARLRELAEKAVDGSVSLQREDGSWPYGEDPSTAWVDSFHSGFNLVALCRCLGSLGDDPGGERRTAALRRGLEHYLCAFFAPDGRPFYYADHTGPVDIRCSAQGVETLAQMALLRGERDTLAKAARIAAWAIEHMRNPDGSFQYQRHPLYTLRTPYLRWGQGPMLVSLALLLRALDEGKVASPP
jgi:hypothetical protein